jgi:UDP-2-acetamido-2-deoxy-ribo-hexuluronate aminotransferase
MSYFCCKKFMQKIQMVDLSNQYLKIQAEVDAAIKEVILNATFINGPAVKKFEQELATYLDVPYVIGCANGTDALQVAMMALDLPPGSEIITPSFSYAALAEMIHLLGHKPVYCEVDPHTYVMDPATISALITPATKVIAPVHLYGQCAPMAEILEIAARHNLYVIEDTAQAIGARYTFPDGRVMRAGTMGHIGTTSFFPSKNLGCYGDGGAVFTRDAVLAEKLRMICNHGQKVKYTHDIVGLNSRLDSLQAAVLSVKLKHLDAYEAARNEVADAYDKGLAGLPGIRIPTRVHNSTHVFHQYTLALGTHAMREALKTHLEAAGIPSMIYYPTPLHRQRAYFNPDVHLPGTEDLCMRVLSLPISTEMDAEQISFIVESIRAFAQQNQQEQA